MSSSRPTNDGCGMAARLQVKQKALEADDQSPEMATSKSCLRLPSATFPGRSNSESSRLPSPPSRFWILRSGRAISRNSVVINRKPCPPLPSSPTHQLIHQLISWDIANGPSWSCRKIVGWGPSKGPRSLDGGCTLGSASCVVCGVRAHQAMADVASPTTSPCSAAGQFGSARCTGTQLPSRLLWLARRQGTNSRERGGVAAKPGSLPEGRDPLCTRVNECVQEAHEVDSGVRLENGDQRKTWR
jgi:hypothetical protein